MSSPVEFRCTIKRMFNGCPKADGWFGCFAHIRGQNDIKLTGKTPIPLSENMVLDVKADRISDTEYKLLEFSIVTKTTKGMISYLASINGVGRLTATKIVNRVGLAAISIIQKGYDETRKMSDDYGLNLSENQINNLVNSVTKMDTKNQLIRFLPELATSPKYIERIYATITDDPIQKIKQNPYILLDVPGISFTTTDAIAIRLGIDPFSPERIGYGVNYILTNKNEGHMYVNLSNPQELNRLYSDTETLLNIRFSDIYEFAGKVIQIINDPAYDLKIKNYQNEKHLYKQSIYNAMIYLIRMITEYNTVPSNTAGITDNLIRQKISEYEQVVFSAKHKNIILNKEQTQAVKTSLKNRMSIITGGPGRGKTSMIDCLAYCWMTIVKKSKVILLAPTGKAMSKLKTDTFDLINNTTHTAKTIDSFIVSYMHSKEFYEKKHMNYDDICGYDQNTLIIIDESSMIDIEKASRLIQCAPDCHYCFVGDADQLPPINPGTFFKDVIDANLQNIPVTKLIAPLRNSGCILENADKVNKNDTDLKYNVTDMPFFPQEKDDEEALNDIIDIFNDERMETPDITQIAMLCPIRKGLIGTDNINMEIQNIMCPENKDAQISFDKKRKQSVYITKGYPIPDTFFGNADKYTRLRVGDIVMNTKNCTSNITSYKYKNNDYWNGDVIPESQAIGMFNGDCGKIIGYIPAPDPDSNDPNLSHSSMIIQFFDNRFAELDITAGDADNISLAYAMTVHKAQGCEYKTVIYISPKRLILLKDIGFLSKNLVYTAFTRAKEKIIVIGSKDSVNECIKLNVPDKNSKFKEMLQQRNNLITAANTP